MISNPEYSQISDTSICQDTTLNLDLHMGNNYIYIWNTGDTSESITISQTGYYNVTITDTLGCSVILDTVYVFVDEFANTATLGPDTTLCAGNKLHLKQGAELAETYSWSDGSEESEIFITESGQYTLTVTSTTGCEAVDSINIIIEGIAPTVDFDYTNPCLGDTTHFTDLSTIEGGATITDKIWDIEGEAFNAETFSRIFNTTGNYFVTLTVTTSDNCIESTIKTVSIESVPHVDFLPVVACVNSPTEFTSLSSTVDDLTLTLEWLINDYIDTNTVLTHTFSEIGMHIINLRAYTPNGCSSDTSKQIEVKTAPQSNFTHTFACKNDPVAFFNETETDPVNPIIRYEWEFDNLYRSSSETPVVEFETTGYHIVSLTSQSINGCENVHTDSVYVGIKPLADFYIPAFCIGQSQQLIDSSWIDTDTIVKWEWNIDSIGEIRMQNPTLKFSSQGTYNFQLEVKTNVGCNDIKTGTLQVHENPEAKYEFFPRFGAAPLTVDFTSISEDEEYQTWIINDSIITENDPTYTFLDTGNYAITLFVENEFHCSDSLIDYLSTTVSSFNIQIIDINTSTENDYMSIFANVVNNGSVPIYEIEFVMQTVNNGTIREIWEGELKPGQLVSYEFASDLYINEKNKIPYICITTNIKGQNDEIYATDEQCTNLINDFSTFDPYPNPATEILLFDIIIPNEGTIEIVFIDNLGKKVKSIIKSNMSAGFHRIKTNIGNLDGGYYTCKIRFNNEIKSKEFIKRNINKN